MVVSIRLTTEERSLAEDEYDIAVAEEAYQEYLENPITYSPEEARALLGL